MRWPPSVRFVLPLLAAPLFASAADVSWSPAGLPPPPASGPALCVRDFLTPAQGAAVLDQALARHPDRDSWHAYAGHLRQRIQAGAGLAPWPVRNPLNAIRHSQRVHDGYTVENVAIEALPGHFATGNLYRPYPLPDTPGAVVLATHGHTRKVEKPEDFDTHGRFHPFVQARCASLARMGATVLSLDMFGCGDSIAVVGADAHRQPVTMSIQLWNSVRAVDFLLSLDRVDPTRVAVTGESGGGTQAFLLTALDPRIAVTVPVVMVSAHFFGGCPCESGLPIHRSPDHFANNVMIAALAAPRPQLVISDGKDWTLNVPKVEFPFLQKIYGYYGAENAVANTHLAAEGHDYGPSKRAAAYRFLAKNLGLNLAAVQDAAGAIDESRIVIEPASALRTFDDAHPFPSHALRNAAAIEAVLRDSERRQKSFVKE